MDAGLGFAIREGGRTVGARDRDRRRVRSVAVRGGLRGRRGWSAPREPFGAAPLRGARARHNGQVTTSRIPVARAVDHGFAKLMPDVDRRAGLAADRRRGAPVVRRSGRADASGVRVRAAARARPGHRRGAGAGAGRRCTSVAARSPCPAISRPPGPAPGRTSSRPTGPARPGRRASAAARRRGRRGARGRRPGLAGSRPGRACADVLVADVFGGSRVPAHLTSVTYAAEAARVLRGGRRLPRQPRRRRALRLSARPNSPRSRAVFEELRADRRARRAARAAASATRCSSPRTAPSTRPPWPAGPRPTPSRPGSNTGAALRDFIGAARPVRDEDAVPSPEPPQGAFGIG